MITVFFKFQRKYEQGNLVNCVNSAFLHFKWKAKQYIFYFCQQGYIFKNIIAETTVYGIHKTDCKSMIGVPIEAFLFVYGKYS